MTMESSGGGEVVLDRPPDGEGEAHQEDRLGDDHRALDVRREPARYAAIVGRGLLLGAEAVERVEEERRPEEKQGQHEPVDPAHRGIDGGAVARGVQGHAHKLAEVEHRVCPYLDGLASGFGGGRGVQVPVLVDDEIAGFEHLSAFAHVHKEHPDAASDEGDHG